MSSWHSYPKIYNVGHAALDNYLKGSLVAEEKIDGSQFSFGKFDGKLFVRSKGTEMHPDKPEGMFQLAVDTAKELLPLLNEGWTYRAEYLAKPKHNTYCYSRVPQKHLIIFDVNPSEEKYLPYFEKRVEAERLGLECVPILWEGANPTLDDLVGLLDKESVLCGQRIEGFVLKRYDLFGPDKKVLLAKHVSEAFKEKHLVDWAERKPDRGDIVKMIVTAYRNENRWAKAVQHLKEKGQLENSPRDIGKLIQEAQADLLQECEAEIKQSLFDYFKSQIARGSIGGLPDWYKGELLKAQCEDSNKGEKKNE